jgi:hypothetical protein
VLVRADRGTQLLWALDQGIDVDVGALGWDDGVWLGRSVRGNTGCWIVNVNAGNNLKVWVSTYHERGGLACVVAAWGEVYNNTFSIRFGSAMVHMYFFFAKETG